MIRFLHLADLALSPGTPIMGALDDAFRRMDDAGQCPDVVLITGGLAASGQAADLAAANLWLREHLLAAFPKLGIRDVFWVPGPAEVVIGELGRAVLRGLLEQGPGPGLLDTEARYLLGEALEPWRAVATQWGHPAMIAFMGWTFPLEKGNIKLCISGLPALALFPGSPEWLRALQGAQAIPGAGVRIVLGPVPMDPASSGPLALHLQGGGPRDAATDPGRISAGANRFHVLEWSEEQVRVTAWDCVEGIWQANEPRTALSVAPDPAPALSGTSNGTPPSRARSEPGAEPVVQRARRLPGMEALEAPLVAAGQEAFVLDLARSLDNACVVVVHAPPGAGLSSLLGTGLVPLLRDEGRKVAYDAFPDLDGLAGRLGLSDLSGGSQAPVIVLDRVEAIFRESDGSRFLTRCLKAQAEIKARWVLGVHDASLGALASLLASLGSEAAPVLFLRMPLLGEPKPRPSLAPSEAEDPAEWATRAFAAAVGRLVASVADDVPSDDPGMAGFAALFADCRLRRPTAPLLPALPLALEMLLKHAPRGPMGRAIQLPQSDEEARKLTELGPEDLLAFRWEQLFYRDDPAVARRLRSLSLLLMAEIVAAPVHVRDLRKRLGQGGRDLLDRLTKEEARLLVRRDEVEPPVYMVCHSLVARSVADIVGDPVAWARLDLDFQVLGLWGDLHRNLVQWRLGKAPAGLPLPAMRLCQEIHEFLPWSDERRAWWGAANKQGVARLMQDRTRVAIVAVGLLALIGVVGTGLWMRARTATEQRLAQEVGGEIKLLRALEKGERGLALGSIQRLHEDFGYDAQQIMEVLDRRGPDDRDALFAEGWQELSEAQRVEVFLSVVDLIHPVIWMGERPSAASLFGAILAGLDAGASGLEGYKVARERVVRSLRSRRAPPPLMEKDPKVWSPVISGSVGIGCPPREMEAWKCAEDETRHQVTLSPFRIGIHEVSVEEYRHFIPDQVPLDPPDLPIRDINWYEALAYATWHEARLPSEAQWEAAARAGSETAFWNGNSEDDLQAVDWVAMNSDARVRPVMSRQHSSHAAGAPVHPFLLIDVHGNVSEWCADWYAPYDLGVRDNPSGPKTGTGKAVRGGSWFFAGANARSSSRIWFEPSFRSNFIGLRLVLPEEPRLQPQ